MLLPSKQVSQLNSMPENITTILLEGITLIVIELLRRNNKNTELVKNKISEMNRVFKEKMEENFDKTQKCSDRLKCIEFLLSKSEDVNSD